MNKNLKIGLLLLILASVYFLVSAVAFFILKESEKDKRAYLEEELSDMVKSRESIASELADFKAKNREIESRLNSVKEQARGISEEILKEKEARRLLTMQLEEEKKKSERLMSDVMAEKEERLSLVHQLSNAEDAQRQLREQYDLIFQAKETLEFKLREMMAGKGVELERIEVTSDYGRDFGREEADTRDEPVWEEEIEIYDEPVEVSRAPRSGSVMVINSKYNFIVSNIGKVDGVAVGSELDVYRDRSLIAKTKVEKLYEKMSAATILPEWKNARIKEGDVVQIPR
ncbi:MAG: hypothetical protein ABH875_04320 [Candidatus Omnitrophota bacterium]